MLGRYPLTPRTARKLRTLCGPSTADE